MPDQRSRLLLPLLIRWSGSFCMCQHTWFGYAGLFRTPTEGQVQGDDRIGFTTCAGNTFNHLGKVWGDNPCGSPSQLEASSSSVFANKASLLPLASC